MNNFKYINGNWIEEPETTKLEYLIWLLLTPAIAFLIAFVFWVSLLIYRDYQERMATVNANYQCIYGSDEHCNYLAEMEYKNK